MSLLMNRFLLAGPPAVGKTTLLSMIPSVIQRATCIDLENTQRPKDIEFLTKTAEELLQPNWRFPLFLGNAGADPCQIAELGYQVIALHCKDKEKYCTQMQERDRLYRQASQGDHHWEHWNRMFNEWMPARNITPILIDSVSLGIDDAIAAIAARFDLRLWEQRVAWITGPRGAGKSSAAMAFSDNACVVDTDRLLSALNESVPPEYRYKGDQSTTGFKKMDRNDFKALLIEAWDKVKKAPRHNCPMVASGYHTRCSWLRTVILDTFGRGQRICEEFFVLVPRIDRIEKNILRRNNPTEVSQYCGDGNRHGLESSLDAFNAMSGQWHWLTCSLELLQRVADHLRSECPQPPEEWGTSG